MGTLLQLDARSHMAHDVVVASIAHEVRQPLTAIIMSASAGFRWLDHSPPDLDQAKQAFKRIVADGHRAGAVVEDIRANFRRDPSTSTALDINELIEGAIALKRSELGKHDVLVRVETDGQLPEVRGNWIQLQQVLLNLIANAIDAMSHNTESRVLCVRSSACGAEHVMVAVADSGMGVGECAVDRIFDPHFTTKPYGMGMGLAICRAIVEAHGGKVWFVPNKSTGAVFEFTLQIDRSS